MGGRNPRKTRPGFQIVELQVIAHIPLAGILHRLVVPAAGLALSSAGIVLLSVIGYFLFRQTLAMTEWLGIALIAAGVIVLQISPRMPV